MPFQRLNSILRRQRQRDPAYSPLPTTPSPSPVSPTKEPSSPVRPSTPPIWSSAAELFTGVRDESLYDDLLDTILDERLKEEAQRSSDAMVTSLQVEEEVEEGELLFDADVWVQLARSEEAVRPVRHCKGSCAMRKVRYRDADIEELRRLTEAFVGDYYDGECTCLDASIAGGLCLPGENFRSAGSVLLGGETSARSVSRPWETSAANAPWEDFAGNTLQGFRYAGSFLLDGESVVSETESVFDYMDEVVQDDGLWEDTAGDAEVSTVVFLPDRGHGTCYSPPSPCSVVSDVSEYDDGTAVMDTEAEEAPSPDLPYPVYCFDTDNQQYYAYTAYNHLLVCPDARSIFPKPSVRTGRAMASHNMY